MIAQEHSWVRQYESHLVCRAADIGADAAAAQEKLREVKDKMAARRTEKLKSIRGHFDKFS